MDYQRIVCEVGPEFSAPGAFVFTKAPWGKTMELYCHSIIKANIIIIASTFDFGDGGSLRNVEFYIDIHTLDRLRKRYCTHSPLKHITPITFPVYCLSEGGWREVENRSRRSDFAIVMSAHSSLRVYMVNVMPSTANYYPLFLCSGVQK
jgi:hypothetical protein